MNRYLKTLILFWKTSFAVQLEYQINFIIELIAMIGTLLGSILILSLFFREGNQLGGWSWQAALVVQGIYTLLDAFTNSVLRPNLTEIVNYVREGTLDFVLLKPIDSQFWLSTRTISPSGIPEAGLGIGLIFWSIRETGLIIGIKEFLIGGIMLLVGLVILYSLWFLVAASSIWFVKTWNATEVLRAILSAGRFPSSAYPISLRIIFTLFLPITFLTTIPAQVLVGEVGAHMIILGICLSMIFYTGSRIFWSFALKHYTSASS